MVVVVTVDLQAIQGMFNPGGAVWSPMRRAASASKRFAQKKIHNRTGLLRDSMFYTTHTRTLSCGFEMGSLLYYAGWVNDGTTGPITAKFHRYLSVPESKGSTKRAPFLFVSGQRAQRYVQIGVNLGLASEGLPGVLL